MTRRALDDCPDNCHGFAIPFAFAAGLVVAGLCALAWATIGADIDRLTRRYRS